MIYELPPLPYGINDLAPVISQETIEYHYGKHEQTYIDNLNKLIEGTPFADKPLEEIIKEADGALFNNASQAWNHIFHFLFESDSHGPTFFCFGLCDVFIGLCLIHL